uniref:Nuclear receptor n=1 Tax=Strongyloides papillosus TaxID=174720 RepID=A0A0N5B896_STREA
MNSYTSDGDKCLICGAPSNGVHFQVNSCRGCAAFYKRTKTLNLEYKCRRGTKNCEIIFNKPQKCRYCRYMRCVTVGMTLKINNKLEDIPKTPKNFQTIELNKTDSYSNFEYYPTTTDHQQHDAHKTTTHSISYASCPYKSYKGDFCLIVQDIKNIFNMPLFGIPNLGNLSITCLQRGALAIENYFSKWNFKHKSEIKITNKVKAIQFLESKQKSLIFIAELLMHLPEFVQLELSEKLFIYRHFWPLFSTFEKIMSSNMVFGKQSNTHLLVLDSDTAYQLEDFSFEADLISTETAQEMSHLVKPTHEFFIKYLYTPFQNMNLDQSEISFITLQIIWSEKKNPSLSSETKLFMEKIIKVASNELHNYYVYHKKLDNYAWRLAEMMKLIQNAQQYSEKLKETFLVAKIFGIFECSFSECDISAMY